MHITHLQSPYLYVAQLPALSMWFLQPHGGLLFTMTYNRDRTSWRAATRISAYHIPCLPSLMERHFIGPFVAIFPSYLFQLKPINAYSFPLDFKLPNRESKNL